MGIETKFLKAGEKLARAGGADIVGELRQILNSLLPQPFRANSGKPAAEGAAQTPDLLTLIHVSRGEDGEAIPSEKVAAVIDVSATLDLRVLREAYLRIVEAKKIKRLCPRQPSQSETTSSLLGIIFAVNASTSLEHLARELERLNQNVSSEDWPDMVVILSHGTISYGVQFPCESISGEFLPAEPGASSSYIPAIYVIMLITPTAEYTFNKMCSLLVAQFWRFLPQGNLPDWKALMTGFSAHAITLVGYQYNLAGNLMPVPRRMYNDRYLPPPAMRIEDQKAELLSAIAFVPWQEGGVILLTGKLPLEGLLIFLEGTVAFPRGVTKRPQTQISQVLPINRIHFIKLLQDIQQRSNLIVKEDERNTIVQKIADEGSTSPFIARLFIGILNLRDRTTLLPHERAEFDNIFNTINRGLFAVRATSRELAKIFNEHKKRVANGSAAKIIGKTLRIEENINPNMEREANDFLNSAVRVLKQGMQSLTKMLGIEVGFLFQKHASFQAGIMNLSTSDPALAAYLNLARQWTEPLLNSRNDIEHNGWTLPKINYVINGSSVTVEEPQISGQAAGAFAAHIFDRLSCFVEDVTVHCLQKRVSGGFCFCEIPISERNPEMPVRFQIALISKHQAHWQIKYNSADFHTV